jgi:hypothetical protein
MDHENFMLVTECSDREMADVYLMASGGNLEIAIDSYMNPLRDTNPGTEQDTNELTQALVQLTTAIIDRSKLLSEVL